MLFNSLDFLILVFITFILYYLSKLRAYQVYILVIASFIFYAWSYPVLLLLLLFSILVNSYIGYKTENEKNQNKRKSYAIFGVVINLVILSSFKYSGLLGQSFFPDSDLAHFLLAIPLPVGISFFTFQGITLVVDTFKNRGNINFVSNSSSFFEYLKKTSLYIALFPQLVAGPIVKAHDFFPQIKTKNLKEIDWEFVFRHLVVGYFLKMVIADNLKDFTFELSYPSFQYLSSVYNLTLLFAYSMQIFADFAGYSLIAIGLSRLFGYKIPQNFNFPYISSSFSEFWRRWHISLSTFLRDYLYFPLGGNRKGKFRTYINLMIVMGLGGLWHGAAWSYMIWGLAHGLFLAIERLINDNINILNNNYILKSGLFKFFKILLIFVVVTLAWLLFKLPDFMDVIAYAHSIQNNTYLFTNELKILAILFYALPIIIYHLIYYFNFNKSAYFRRYISPTLYGFMLVMLLLNSGSPQDFIYFQF